MRDRVRPPRDSDELLNRLRDDGLFETRQKAMMFAAALGYCADQSKAVQPLDGYGEGIPLSVFTRAVDDTFIDALAVSKANDLNVLKNSEGDRRLETFEYFAMLGLQMVREYCYERGKDPIVGLLELIDRYGGEPGSGGQLPGLDASLKELGRLF